MFSSLILRAHLWKIHWNVLHWASFIICNPWLVREMMRSCYKPWTEPVLIEINNTLFWPFQWHHNEHDGITSILVVYSTICSGADQRKHQSCASLAFVGEFTGDVNSPHKGPVTRNMFPFDDIIMSPGQHELNNRIISKVKSIYDNRSSPTC